MEEKPFDGFFQGKERSPERMRLERIELKGFRSVSPRSPAKIDVGDVTVLLGANGAGKSNLVLFFKMLGHMMTSSLQNFVGRQGVSQLLFHGPKATESLEFTLHFSSKTVRNTYGVKLSFGLPDRLFVSGESVTHLREGHRQPQEYFLPVGRDEVSIKEDTREDTCKTSRVIARFLSGVRAYQFHDTSETARIRGRSYVDDSKHLLSDGGNLAAFLKRLKEGDEFRPYYERIVRHVRRVMPQFGDFMLEPLSDNERYVRLNWRNAWGNDYLFGPDQLSDGSLRFMALAALFLQPPQLMPGVLVVDEPELGLHPAAIVELAGMVRIAAQNTQVLLATQSPCLVDEFSPEQLLIVEFDKKERCSVFSRLDAEALREWLERYSLSDLWEKNVLGAQP